MVFVVIIKFTNNVSTNIYIVYVIVFNIFVITLNVYNFSSNSIIN